MTRRLITAVCKADMNLKHALFPGNFNSFLQVQPKRLERRQFLSQLSSHTPKGFDKPFNQRNGNKSGVCTAGGIGADRKYSSLSGGADGREGDEDKSKVRPDLGSENKRQGFSSIAGILGVCWVHLNKELNWKGVVDNFLGRRTHLTQLVNAAKSTNPQIQFSAVHSLCQLLTSGRNPPIDFLISCNILPTLVNCLSKNEFIINRIPAIQLGALLALTKIIMTGTSEQSQAVVEAGAVPHFLSLLKSPDQKIREIALIALDRLIAKGPQLKDGVINLGVVASLLNCIQPDTTRNFLHEVLGITARTLMYMTDVGEKQIQIVIDNGILPKLVQLLDHGEVKVQDPALRAVFNIFKHGTDDQVQSVLNCDALSHFHNLLSHPNTNICQVALLTLSQVATRNFTRVQTVIDAGLVPLIIHHMQKGDFLTQRAANNALSWMTTSGTKEQIEHLIDSGVIPLFTNLWNSKDSMVLFDGLVGIHNILFKLPVNQGSGDNACIFNNETNDQVQAVLNCDALSHFANLLSHPKKKICEEALGVLSKIAASNYSGVQAVIDAGLVPLIIHQLEKGDLQTQKAAANTLSSMTVKGTKEHVEHLIDCGMIPLFTDLLSCKDSVVYWDVLVGIHNILDKLLVNQGSEVKACTFNNGTNDQVQALLNCGALSHYHILLNHPNKSNCEKALRVLSKVAASNFSRVQAFIDAGLVPLIIHHMEKGDFQTQKIAAAALSCMTFKGTKEHVEHLVDCGVIPLFTDLLSCKDSVVVWNVLVGIHNILSKLSVNQGSQDKACTLIEECGGLDKMKTLQNHESMKISKIAHDIFLKFSSDNVAE